MKTLPEITAIGVVGAGTMGAGIAQVAAEAGIDAVLFDIDGDVLQASHERIKHFIDRAAAKGRLSKARADAAVEHLQATTDMADFARCQIVIEAVPEIMDLKRRVFADLEGVVADNAILATNTSTLSVSRIGGAVESSWRAVGMHFFNPAPLMPLVEVIAGAATSQIVTEAALDLTRALGKTPVKVKDSPGFVVNRVARPFYLEALRMLESGVADHAMIDRILREGGGFRMGPFELMDLIGIDVNYAASISVYEAMFGAARFRPSILQQQAVDSGQLGRKTGQGWYDYSDKGDA